MNRRLRLRALALGRLADLRALQRKQSEAGVAQADARTRRAQAAKMKSAEIVAADERAWSACLTERADLALAAAWAAQVTRSVKQHVRLTREADSAEQAMWRARADCAHAIARAKATDKIARSAAKKLAAQRVEARLQEIEDAQARKRRRP
jgi:hypothetical protein